MSNTKTLCCTAILSTLIFGSGPVDAGFGLFKRCRAKSACCVPLKTTWTCKAYLYSCNENGCPCPVETGEGSDSKEELAQNGAVARAFVKLPPTCKVVRTVACFTKTTEYCCGHIVRKCYSKTYCGLPPIGGACAAARAPKAEPWFCECYIQSETNEGYSCDTYGTGEGATETEAKYRAYNAALVDACVQIIDYQFSCYEQKDGPREAAAPAPEVSKQPAPEAPKEAAKQ